MSYQLKSTSSVKSLLRKGDRLCRCCDREGNGSRQYADAVTAAMTDLKGVAEQLENATSQRYADYDAVRLADNHLGDAIRSAFFACRKHDWTSGSDAVLEKVFPDGTFFPIVSMPWGRKAEVITRIISRLTEVAADNDILTVATAELTVSFDRFNAACEAHEKSVLEYNRCKALERLARKEYADRYNFVYFKACGEIGRKNANRLFPVTQGHHKKILSGEAEESPIAQAA
jgi:hypothetical protein